VRYVDGEIVKGLRPGDIGERQGRCCVPLSL
jgi:hypothetical protein